MLRRLFQAIMDTLEAPVEERRLRACGLSGYLPKATLQNALRMIAVRDQARSSWKVQSMKADRPRARLAYEVHYLKMQESR